MSPAPPCSRNTSSRQHSVNRDREDGPSAASDRRKQDVKVPQLVRGNPLLIVAAHRGELVQVRNGRCRVRLVSPAKHVAVVCELSDGRTERGNHRISRSLGKELGFVPIERCDLVRDNEG